MGGPSGGGGGFNPEAAPVDTPIDIPTVGSDLGRDQTTVNPNLPGSPPGLSPSQEEAVKGAEARAKEAERKRIEAEKRRKEAEAARIQAQKDLNARKASRFERGEKQIQEGQASQAEQQARTGTLLTGNLGVVGEGNRAVRTLLGF